MSVAGGQIRGKYHQDMIVAFKYESHATGHQINDESSLITEHFRDYAKLRQKMKSITLSGLIFQLENIFAYHLLIIIIPLLMLIWCPGNIWVSRVLHVRQNLVSR